MIFYDICYSTYMNPAQAKKFLRLSDLSEDSTSQAERNPTEQERDIEAKEFSDRDIKLHELASQKLDKIRQTLDIPEQHLQRIYNTLKAKYEYNVLSPDNVPSSVDHFNTKSMWKFLVGVFERDLPPTLLVSLQNHPDYNTQQDNDPLGNSK